MTIIFKCMLTDDNPYYEFSWDASDVRFLPRVGDAVVSDKGVEHDVAKVVFVRPDWIEVYLR